MITVAMPMYNAKAIGWLALESLCRQECPYPWELMIMQETEGGMPEEEIMAYSDRLKKAGCIEIHLMMLDQWVPLTQKWAIMGRLADAKSLTFVMQAADCYSDKNRLKRSHEAIRDGYDWTHSLKGVFWDLLTNERAVYVHKPQYPTALDMSARASLVRNLPQSELLKGIDRWLFDCMGQAKGSRLKVHEDTSDDWGGGIDTHGYNNISKKRGDLIAQKKQVYFHCDAEIHDLLPAEVADRLKAMIP